MMPQTIKLEDAGKRLRLKKMQIAGFKANAARDGSLSPELLYSKA
jgi:hypothetical protein